MKRKGRLICLMCSLAVVALSLCPSCAPQPPVNGSNLPGQRSSNGIETPIPAPVSLPDGLRPRVEAAIKNVRDRDVLVSNSFWTVFHAILGLGPNVTLLDEKTGQHVNAIDYICRGGELTGLEFILTRDGLDVATMKIPEKSQGHQDQFIAEMAQWGMTPDRKFIVNGKDYTFMDFIRHSKARASVRSNQELSWAIIIIGQFFGTDASWTNNAGEKLKFEDVVRYELDQPIPTTPASDDAACGGTHRLFGLSWVYHLHLRKGGQTVGVWKDVADKTSSFQQLAHKLQNSDGSFSTDFFKKRENVSSRQRRIYTTGHIMEWLALSLPDADLKKPWVEDAATALSTMILEIRTDPMESGALYHAVHGLQLYHARVWDKDNRDPLKAIVPLPPNGS